MALSITLVRTSPCSITHLPLNTLFLTSRFLTRPQEFGRNFRHRSHDQSLLSERVVIIKPALIKGSPAEVRQDLRGGDELPHSQVQRESLKLCIEISCGLLMKRIQRKYHSMIS